MYVDGNFYDMALSTDMTYFNQVTWTMAFTCLTNKEQTLSQAPLTLRLTKKGYTLHVTGSSHAEPKQVTGL